MEKYIFKQNKISIKQGKFDRKWILDSKFYLLILLFTLNIFYHSWFLRSLRDFYFSYCYQLNGKRFVIPLYSSLSLCFRLCLSTTYFRNFKSANWACVIGFQPWFQAVWMIHMTTWHEHSFLPDRNVLNTDCACWWFQILFHRSSQSTWSRLGFTMFIFNFYYW